MFLDPEASSEGPGTYLWICLLTAGTSFLISLARYGLETVSKSKVMRLVPDGPAQQRFEHYFERLDRTIIGSLLLMVVSDALFFLSLYAVIRTLLASQHAFVSLFAAAMLGAIYLVLSGRILARTLVERDSERHIVRVLPWLHAVGVALKPITTPLNACRRSLLHALGRTDPDEKDEAFTEEIRATLEEGERDGVVAEAEKEIIENVVEFRDLDVSQVMTQRTDLHWIDANASVFEALKYASERGHARLPVATGDADHVVGVFYVRDVIDRLDGLDELKREPVRSIARPAHFVPETKHLVELLKEFRQNKIQIAIVVDEYGGTVGLVTVEDILEAIVGEIHDEHDPKGETPELQLVGSDHAIVDGRARLETVSEALGIELNGSDEVDTIGGLVFSTLGRVPRPGELLHHDGLEIRVLAADERRVRKLELKVLSRDAR